MANTNNWCGCCGCSPRKPQAFRAVGGTETLCVKCMKVRTRDASPEDAAHHKAATTARNTRNADLLAELLA